VKAVAGVEEQQLEEFVSAILTASWLLVGLSTRSVEDVDANLTLTQFRTMAVLARRGQTNLSGLAAELSVNASTAMRMIDRLVAVELVRRSENPASRREVLLNLTPKGERLVEDVVKRRRAEILRIVAAMDAHERQLLTDALRSFAAQAEAAGIPPAPASIRW
jgi:DNA-binding MarR family transcriptional regulator